VSLRRPTACLSFKQGPPQAEAMKALRQDQNLSCLSLDDGSHVWLLRHNFTLVRSNSRNRAVNRARRFLVVGGSLHEAPAYAERTSLRRRHGGNYEHLLDR
jgi:hypothetical protein